MSQNKVQFQKGISLPDFMGLYGTEEQCLTRYLSGDGPMGLFVQSVEVKNVAS